MTATKKPNVTVVYKPLNPKKTAQEDPFARAENEDDDGYDPYSDRREEQPLFERSPWD